MTTKLIPWAADLIGVQPACEADLPPLPDGALIHPAWAGELASIFPTREAAAQWLAGIIDGEGHVSAERRVVRITNTDRSIIAATWQALEQIGVRASVYGRPHEAGGLPCFDVQVARSRSLARLAEYMRGRLMSARKRAELAKLERDDG